MSLVQNIWIKPSETTTVMMFINLVFKCEFFSLDIAIQAFKRCTNRQSVGLSENKEFPRRCF